MSSKNNTEFNQTLNNMVQFVLIQKDGTESIRKIINNKFGFSNPYEMLEYVKRNRKCSLETAREIILNSPTLMKIMFIIA